MQDTAAGKNSVNLIALRQGDVVRLSGGGLVVIIENPGDGLWVYGVAVDGDGVTTEGDEPIFAQDIVEQLSEAEAQKFQKPIGGGQ